MTGMVLNSIVQCLSNRSGARPRACTLRSAGGAESTAEALLALVYNDVSCDEKLEVRCYGANGYSFSGGNELLDVSINASCNSKGGSAEARVTVSLRPRVGGAAATGLALSLARLAKLMVSYEYRGIPLSYLCGCAYNTPVALAPLINGKVEVKEVDHVEYRWDSRWVLVKRTISNIITSEGVYSCAVTPYSNCFDSIVGNEVESDVLNLMPSTSLAPLAYAAARKLGLASIMLAPSLLRLLGNYTNDIEIQSSDCNEGDRCRVVESRYNDLYYIALLYPPVSGDHAEAELSLEARPTTRKVIDEYSIVRHSRYHDFNGKLVNLEIKEHSITYFHCAEAEYTYSTRFKCPFTGITVEFETSGYMVDYIGPRVAGVKYIAGNGLRGFSYTAVDFGHPDLHNNFANLVVNTALAGANEVGSPGGGSAAAGMLAAALAVAPGDYFVKRSSEVSADTPLGIETNIISELGDLNIKGQLVSGDNGVISDVARAIYSIDVTRLHSIVLSYAVSVAAAAVAYLASISKLLDYALDPGSRVGLKPLTDSISNDLIDFDYLREPVALAPVAYNENIDSIFYHFTVTSMSGSVAEAGASKVTALAASMINGVVASPGSLYEGAWSLLRELEGRVNDKDGRQLIEEIKVKLEGMRRATAYDALASSISMVRSCMSRAGLDPGIKRLLSLIVMSSSYALAHLARRRAIELAGELGLSISGSASALLGLYNASYINSMDARRLDYSTNILFSVELGEEREVNVEGSSLSISMIHGPPYAETAAAGYVSGKATPVIAVSRVGGGSASLAVEGDDGETMVLLVSKVYGSTACLFNGHVKCIAV